ncbi:hypothetical protein ANTPLA_LOCUS10192 [Anthophora plagiata]
MKKNEILSLHLCSHISYQNKNYTARYYVPYSPKFLIPFSYLFFFFFFVVYHINLRFFMFILEMVCNI